MLLKIPSISISSSLYFLFTCNQNAHTASLRRTLQSQGSERLTQALYTEQPGRRPHLSLDKVTNLQDLLHVLRVRVHLKSTNTQVPTPTHPTRFQTLHQTLAYRTVR
jgi:hypothetical protein